MRRVGRTEASIEQCEAIDTFWMKCRESCSVTRTHRMTNEIEAFGETKRVGDQRYVLDETLPAVVRRMVGFAVATLIDRDDSSASRKRTTQDLVTDRSGENAVQKDQWLCSGTAMSTHMKGHTVRNAHSLVLDIPSSRTRPQHGRIMPALASYCERRSAVMGGSCGCLRTL